MFRKPNPKTAFCFDLDGTVTSCEVLPAISSELGITEEMGLLTDLTINGMIPFEMSFRLRCLVLKSIPVSRVQSITAEIPVDPTIIEFIHAHREQCFLVTGNLDVWVSPLIERCGCRAYTSKAECEGDAITSLMHVIHKGEAVREIAQKFDRLVAIGDGANDVLMFEEADISIAYGGVHAPAPSLFKYANYATYNGTALCTLLSTL